MDVERIKQLTTQHIENLVQELNTLIEKRNSPGKLRSAVLIEKTNLVLALISFNPHNDPEEESIEISIEMEINSSTGVSVFSDICWSDGEIIEEIIKSQLDLNSRDELIGKLNNLLESKLSVIIAKMTELIITNPMPRYRST